MTELPLLISALSPADLPSIERLMERAFGPGRFARTAYRLREGILPDFSLSFSAHVGTMLVGANFMTRINCGTSAGLLLGPLTVEPAFRSRGIGKALITRSLEAARTAGHGLVILVGDEPYYSRFGFKRVPMGQLTLPGPVDPARLLYCELITGRLAIARGQLARCAS
jgi:predicted N-acetyltransferase YhbS